MRNLREPRDPRDPRELERERTQPEKEAPRPTAVPPREMRETVEIHDAQPESLLPERQVEEMRARWSAIQGGFVDEPRRAVEEADALVASAIKMISEGFTDQRAQLEKQWTSGAEASTESLRLALQQYRSFFSRLLSV